MDSRLHGKYVNHIHYEIPHYLKTIGELIELGAINLKFGRNGNGYVLLDNETCFLVYRRMEQILILPSNSVTEININFEKLQLEIYTFHTVSSYWLKNLQREYYVGYGMDYEIGIYIDIKQDLMILLQLQIWVNEQMGRGNGKTKIE